MPDAESAMRQADEVLPDEHDPTRGDHLCRCTTETWCCRGVGKMGDCRFLLGVPLLPKEPRVSIPLRGARA